MTDEHSRMSRGRRGRLRARHHGPRLASLLHLRRFPHRASAAGGKTVLLEDQGSPAPEIDDELREPRPPPSQRQKRIGMETW